MKPIRTAEDHQSLLDEIAGLMGAEPGTPEADRLEVLAVLASDYERRAVPDAPDPVEVLAVAMRGQGRTQADLSDVLGSRARASEILSRRRSLSGDMIERLSRAWSIPRRLLSGPGRTVERARRPGGRTLSIALAAVLLPCAAIAAPFAWYGRDLPPIAPLLAEAGAADAVSQLPPHVSLAFVAAEDRRFLRHRGYDPVALIRAAGEAAGGKARPGSSTLTQQLVKNSLLSGEGPSVRRKVREILLARQLETRLSKDQILELYFRHVYFGDGAYGLEAAAEHYFGREANRLTLGQAAYLASLVDAPNALRFDMPANRPRALQARDRVLERMARAGFVTPAAERWAARERLW